MPVTVTIFDVPVVGEPEVLAVVGEVLAVGESEVLAVGESEVLGIYRRIM